MSDTNMERPLAGEDEAELECRVCRSGAEEGRPLFHPCKCSGSIKYVHQDCLLEWIRFSNQTQPKCELCGEPFTFTPVYREGAPQNLPLHELVYGMLPHAGGAIRRYFRLSAFAVLWGGILPLVTAYTVELCTAYVLEERFEPQFSIHKLWHSFWNGMLECIVILTVSATLSHIWDGIQRDAGQMEADPQGDGVLELLGRRWLAIDIPRPAEVDAGAQHPEGEGEQQGLVNANTLAEERKEEEIVQDIPQEDVTPTNDEDEVAPLADAATMDDPQPPVAIIGGAHGGDDPLANDEGEAAAPQNMGGRRLVDEFEGEEQLIGELLGVERSLFSSILRCFRLCLYNIGFILTFEVCPVQIGRAILLNAGITLSDILVPVQIALESVHNASTILAEANATAAQVEVGMENPGVDANEALVQQYLTRRAFALVCATLGYAVIIFTLVVAYLAYILVQCAVDEQFRERHIRLGLSVIRGIHKWGKIASVLSIHTIIIPSLMGWLLDIVTLKACNITLHDRVVLCQQMPLACGLIHWMIGLFFVFHITYCATELRKILHRDVLAGILPRELEPDVNAMEFLADRPTGLMLKKTCILLCIEIPAVMLCVFLPVRIGHIFCPYARPLQLKFDELFLELQLPLELLVFHVVVPLALERVHYRSVIAGVQRTFLKHSCHVLGLESLLEPEDPGTDAAIHPHSSLVVIDVVRHVCTEYVDYSVRCVILVLWTLLSLVFAFSWVIHIPLVVGRNTLLMVNLPADHDFYNESVGLSVIWAGMIVFRYFWRECVANTNILAILRAFTKWTLILGKIVTLSTLWLTVIPLMLGVIFELVVVVPLRVPANETPKVPVVQCWALGLVFLKIWVRLVTLGAFGDTEWKRRFERLRQNGVANVQFLETFTEILWPMFLHVGDYLFVPYLFGKVFATWYFDVLPFAPVVFRHSFVVYLATRAIVHTGIWIWGHLVRLHDQIRDNHYLLGLELSNRPTDPSLAPVATILS